MSHFRFRTQAVKGLLLLLTGISSPGRAIDFQDPLWCGTTSEGGGAFLGGGRYIPSQGQLHVLVIFVQFPDDSYDIDNNQWPKGQPPRYLNTFIDSSPAEMSTDGNFTHFFREMSLGKLILTGKAIHIFTPNERQYYLENGMRRDAINREVLEEVDLTESFAPYDNWIRGSNHDHLPGQDGIVDMIFMLYRNVAQEFSNPGDVMNDLGFYGGVVGLGTSSSYQDVDGGARHILMGFQMSGASGTTSVVSKSDGLGLPPWRVQIHELSHFFFGGNSWHHGGGFWAMLNDWAFRYNDQRQSCANSYERELLGWIEPDSLGPDVGEWHDLSLNDFVTSGESFKIKVPGSNAHEFFRLEYHNKVSQFDVPEIHDPSAKGLYILHQFGERADKIRLLPADGRWTWRIAGWKYPSYYPAGLPIFERESVDRVNGYDDSWRIPLTGLNLNQQLIHFYKDHITGKVIEQTVFRGDGNDAFKSTQNNVFTPWSNPNSQSTLMGSTEIAIEVLEELSNSITFNVFIGLENAQKTPPAVPQNFKAGTSNGKPKLTWQRNIEPDLSGYKLYKKLQTQNSGTQTFVISISKDATQYTDQNFDTGGRKPSDTATYWLTAVDLTMLESNETREYSFRGTSLIQWKALIVEDVPQEYDVLGNFPNPFNPVTTIRYDLPENSFVTVKVFDLIGRDIKTLITGNIEPGYQSVIWDGKDSQGNTVSSGMYMYRLDAISRESDKEFHMTRKMVLLQ